MLISLLPLILTREMFSKIVWNTRHILIMAAIEIASYVQLFSLAASIPSWDLTFPVVKKSFEYQVKCFPPLTVAWECA